MPLDRLSAQGFSCTSRSASPIARGQEHCTLRPWLLVRCLRPLHLLWLTHVSAAGGKATTVGQGRGQSLGTPEWGGPFLARAPPYTTIRTVGHGGLAVILGSFVCCGGQSCRNFWTLSGRPLSPCVHRVPWSSPFPLDRLSAQGFSCTSRSASPIAREQEHSTLRPWLLVRWVRIVCHGVRRCRWTA